MAIDTRIIVEMCSFHMRRCSCSDRQECFQLTKTPKNRPGPHKASRNLALLAKNGTNLEIHTQNLKKNCILNQCYTLNSTHNHMRYLHNKEISGVQEDVVHSYSSGLWAMCMDNMKLKTSSLVYDYFMMLYLWLYSIKFWDDWWLVAWKGF